MTDNLTLRPFLPHYAHIARRNAYRCLVWSHAAARDCLNLILEPSLPATGHGRPASVCLMSQHTHMYMYIYIYFFFFSSHERHRFKELYAGYCSFQMSAVLKNPPAQQYQVSSCTAVRNNQTTTAAMATLTMTKTMQNITKQEQLQQPLGHHTSAYINHSNHSNHNCDHNTS